MGDGLLRNSPRRIRYLYFTGLYPFEGAKSDPIFGALNDSV